MHCLYHWSPTQTPGEQHPVGLFVHSPHLAIHVGCSPFGSQALSPEVPHDRHFSLVSPHQVASQVLKFIEQQPFPLGTGTVGAGVFGVGGVGAGGVGEGGVGEGGVGFVGPDSEVIFTLINVNK